MYATQEFNTVDRMGRFLTAFAIDAQPSWHFFQLGSKAELRENAWRSEGPLLGEEGTIKFSRFNLFSRNLSTVLELKVLS
jgi:hypothetical protein